ncbi:MAG: glycosyltransferase family 4 protein [Phycisphaerales bacterium]
MTAPATIVVLTNVPTPYRLALHARIDRELPEVRLLTVYTHDVADQGWTLSAGDQARVFRFGQGDSVNASSRVSSIPREWAKGGRICRWLAEQSPRPAALLLCGYNDPGRLRVLRWCTRHRLPVFLVGDSNIKGEQVSGIKALIKRVVVSRVVRACAGVMPCGSFGAEFFRKYGARDERIFYVPYEPDYALIENLPPATIDAARERFGFQPHRRRIVFCGRFIPAKRPDLAIDAFARLAGQRTDWDLVMIGDGDLRRACEQRVPAALSSRVRFTGFIGNQDVISAIYKSSDVFLLPSVYEPWGVVINESACAGMAIVATNTVGAAGELVRDGVNGRTFPPSDLDALTAALLDVTDPARLQQYRAASAGVLADWRDRGDPVKGIRSALRTVGVLPST